MPPTSLGQLAALRGVPGRAGRTVAALDVTLDDLTFSLSPALGSPLMGAGLRGGSFRLRRRSIVLDGLQVVPGVRVSGKLPRRGSARLRISGRSAARGRVRISPARRGARAARGPERARAPAGGAAAAGGECGAKRGEDGAIPAQDGVVFRPTPHLACPLHFV